MFVNQLSPIKEAVLSVKGELRHMQIMALLKYYAIPCKENRTLLGNYLFIQFPATYAKQVEGLTGEEVYVPSNTK